MPSIVYPHTPPKVPQNTITPSRAFNREVKKVIAAILLFILLYLILIAAAAALAIAACYAGFLVIVSAPGIMTLAFGLGLIGLGISVLFFLLKFMFATKKEDNSHYVQITETEQPELFAFIRRLTQDTHTAFPKKIFISSEVNAAVFYNSNFWSMFLPIRKNLVIGLGLVNSVNISEFKAIMAHEFGHFSQRSMKLGSFTYNVNHIIHDMLYNNTGYNQFLQSWGKWHSFLALFATISARIAHGIQRLLQKMYGLVNRSYLSLSRQMEFHADAIAASVSGSNNLATSLHRLELTQGSFDIALSKANEWLKDNKIAHNIFENQRSVLNTMASQFNLPIENGLPVVNSEKLKSHIPSRIQYRNQWASHPSLEERIARLNQINLPVEPSKESAWTLFAQPEALQQQLTQILYQHVTLKEGHQPYTNSEFASNYQQEIAQNSLPEIYQGYYDARYIELNDWNIETLSTAAVSLTTTTLLTEERTRLPARIRGAEKDIEILKAISNQKIEAPTFDFDGEKFSRRDANSILQQMEEELTRLKAALAQSDKDIYTFAYKQAASRQTSSAAALKEQYNQLRQFEIAAQTYYDISRRVMEMISPFYQKKLPHTEIQQTISTLKSTLEKELKFQLHQLCIQNRINATTHPVICERISHFINSNYLYFTDNNFRNEELQDLYGTCVEAGNAMNDQRFEYYKKLLLLQQEQLS